MKNKINVEAGDWITCYDDFGMDTEPGKATRVTNDYIMVEFCGEMNYDLSPSFNAAEKVYFWEIKEIITDKNILADLEKRYREAHPLA